MLPAFLPCQFIIRNRLRHIDEEEGERSLIVAFSYPINYSAVVAVLNREVLPRKSNGRQNFGVDTDVILVDQRHNLIKN